MAKNFFIIKIKGKPNQIFMLRTEADRKKLIFVFDSREEVNSFIKSQGKVGTEILRLGDIVETDFFRFGSKIDQNITVLANGYPSGTIDTFNSLEKFFLENRVMKRYFIPYTKRKKSELLIANQDNSKFVFVFDSKEYG